MERVHTGSELHILAQLNVPVSQVDEMLPTVVLVQAETDLDERTPLRPLGLADKVQAGFLRGSVGLQGIALNTGANNILPTGWTEDVTLRKLVSTYLQAKHNFRGKCTFSTQEFPNWLFLSSKRNRSGLTVQCFPFVNGRFPKYADSKV